jgi:TDG/mug DNA glycosylase family protein
LPDLLRNALDVVFVGINPSVFSAARGRYFARPSNRFWPCLSRSILSQRTREALSLETLRPEHDSLLLEYGIGFTDLVKRATPKAGDLAPSELAAGVEQLLVKLDRHRPRVACFHGVTGYRYVHRALTKTTGDVRLGLQDIRVGTTGIYLVPNPSGANAHFTREDQIRWYDRLAEHLEASNSGGTRLDSA